MRTTRALVPTIGASIALLAFAQASRTPPASPDHPTPEQATMKIHYLEIVTPDVDATCAALEKTHGVTFAAPSPALGNARTAPIAGGGRMGVRAPLRETETPVVRPYRYVEDLEDAVREAEANGAIVALPSMDLPGEGRIAIVIQGGIEHGLWSK
ncbi:MAG: hypothetical protein KDA28_03485 [Phycisphaerales bacterium]|nr:hypothetical protein [Phycisphaerales bacterium]